MELQSFAIVETAAALLTQVLSLRVNVLLRMLLNSDRFVLHRRTSSGNHRYGLVALRVRLLLDRLNGLVLLVLLFQEVLLFHLLRVLFFHLTLLSALIVTCGRRRCILNANWGLNVVDDALVSCKLRLCTEAFAAIQARVRCIGVLSHMSDECSLLQELLATNRALVRYTTVQFSMIHQLELSRKRCATVLAYKRIQTSMETRVHY